MTEDLNIERNIRRIVEKLWYDVEKYPKVKDIYAVTGLSERTLYRYVNQYQFPRRKKIIRDSLKPQYQDEK